MKRTVIPAALMLLMAACGGGDASVGDDASVESQPAVPAAPEAGQSAGGSVVNPQPPGSGYASVDGLEFTLDTPGLVACSVSDDEFGFSYIMGDNEVNLGGGASISGGQWYGTVTLRLFAGNGATTYTALIVDNPSAIAIDGDSVSYSGPMEKTETTSEGTLSDPVDVGVGTFSSTCG